MRIFRISVAVSLLAAAGGLLTPSQAVALLRGDVDKNGVRDITDAINILNALFLGGQAIPCPGLGDVNGDSAIDITDPVTLLSHLFLGAAAPPALSLTEEAECKGLDPNAVLRGMQVYEKDDIDNNFRATPFACATCHEVMPDNETTMLRPGNSMHDALRRPRYKTGLKATFLEATNVCRVDWMHTTEFKDTDQPFKDMVTYLELFTPEGPAPELIYQIECDPQPGPAGTPQAGCELFNRSCAICHGTNAEIPELSVPLLDLNVADLDDPVYIRNRIRRSGPSQQDRPDVVYPCLLGKQMAMPFWSKEKLSDQQVEDLISYVLEARVQARAGNTTLRCTEEPPPPPEGVVVRQGVLTKHQHGVEGIIEELDTGGPVRTIRLRDFKYDGGGARVRLWLFKEGQIELGIPVGPADLRRPSKYENETLVIEATDGATQVTPDKYDSVSIWCVVFGVDFGSGKLETVP